MTGSVPVKHKGFVDNVGGTGGDVIRNAEQVKGAFFGARVKSARAVVAQPEEGEGDGVAVTSVHAHNARGIDCC